MAREKERIKISLEYLRRDGFALTQRTTEIICDYGNHSYSSRESPIENSGLEIKTYELTVPTNQIPELMKDLTKVKEFKKLSIEYLDPSEWVEFVDSIREEEGEESP